MSSEFKDEESEESRICQEWLCPSALPNYNRDFYYNIWDGVFRLQSEYKTTPATLFYRKTSLNSKWVTVLWSQRVLIGCRSSNGSESDPNDDDGGSSCRVDLHCSQNHFWKRLFSRTCRSVYLFMLYIQLTLSMLMSPDGTDPTCVSPLRFSSGSVCICRYYRLTWWTARRHRAEYYFLLSLPPCGSVIAPAFSCRLLFQTVAMKKPNTTLMRTDDELSGQEAAGGPDIFKNSSGIK